MRDLDSQGGRKGTALSGHDVGGLVRDLLRDGLPVKVAVTGSSMVPFIRAHDVVCLRPGPGGDLLGGVIAFLRPGERLVVHRVIARTGAGVVTRGDASPETDEPVGWGDVLGHVTGVERRGQPVGLGLGPERALVAVLSRWGLLQVGTRQLVALKRRVFRRSRDA